MKTRRPALRGRELDTAFASALQAGLSVRATRFYPDGGFALEFGEVEKPTLPTDLDIELLRLEARYGEG